MFSLCPQRRGHALAVLEEPSQGGLSSEGPWMPPGAPWQGWGTPGLALGLAVSGTHPGSAEHQLFWGLLSRCLSADGTMNHNWKN